MIDFILASFVIGGIVMFYLNNKKKVDAKAKEVEDLFS